MNVRSAARDSRLHAAPRAPWRDEELMPLPPRRAESRLDRNFARLLAAVLLADDAAVTDDPRPAFARRALD